MHTVPSSADGERIKWKSKRRNVGPSGRIGILNRKYISTVQVLIKLIEFREYLSPIAKTAPLEKQNKLDNARIL